MESNGSDFREPSCEVHVISVCGPVRQENQDAGVAWRDENENVALVVSDGMGGHAAGREAAEIVVRSCVEVLRERPGGDWEAVLREAVRQAQAAVVRAARAHAAAAMGATAALAVVERFPEPLLHVAHVGDSRVYLFRGRSLYRLTTDHSLVAQMVREGLLPEEEAFGHPDSNVIQRAIGQVEQPLEAEVQAPIPLDPEDVVLVCSDGLHGFLRDGGIVEAILRPRSAVEICEDLLAAALAAGSEDNITIGCIRFAADGRPRRPTRVPLPISEEDEK